MPHPADNTPLHPALTAPATHTRPPESVSLPAQFTGTEQPSFMRRVYRAIRDQPLPLAIMLAVALFIGAAISMETVVRSTRGVLQDAMQRSLMNTAQIAALTVDPQAHGYIRSGDHQNSAVYEGVAQPLRAIRSAIPEIRYIYTFRPVDGKIRFVVDATSMADRTGTRASIHHAQSTSYAPPTPEMTDAVSRGTSTVSVDFDDDAFATVASAYAPVRNPNGSIECFVGVDMDASEYQSRIARMSYAHKAGLGVALLASVLFGVVVYVLRSNGRRAQMAARATADRLERTAYNLPGAIFEFREYPTGVRCMPFASNGLREVLGLSPESVRTDATPMTELVHPDDIDRLTDAVARSKEGMTLWHEEYRVNHPDRGERWIEGRSIPNELPDGSIVWYGYVCDITERKQTALALEEAKAAAEAASQAKNEFVAKVSHELRTPLSAIAGYTELLREAKASAAGRAPNGAATVDTHISEHDAVDAIGRNATHLLTLVNDILDVARIEAGRMKTQRVPTDLRDLAQDVMDGFRIRVAERRLSLHTDVASSVPPLVLSDPVRLRQVLTNLVTNAVKFTDRGSVWMTVRTDGQQSIAISVRDTGPGLTQAQIARLFQPFTQVDNSMSRSFGGAGLGLAICKQLTELLGGRITVQSTPGRGSEFTVWLPRIEPDLAQVTTAGSERTDIARHPAMSRDGAPRTPVVGAAEVRPGQAERMALAGTTSAMAMTAQPACDPPLAGCRILLAEDGPDNARLIRHHLRVAGAVVTHVWDGRGAARLAEHEGGTDAAPFDLILLDMQMPEMDGYAAAEHMRAYHVTVPIIALTAHASPADETRCREAGCNDYATKPISGTTLAALCRKWLRTPPTAAGRGPGQGASAGTTPGNAPVV